MTQNVARLEPELVHRGCSGVGMDRTTCGGAMASFSQR